MNHEKFEPFINHVARRLCGDFHLREDLGQEMRLAIWQLPEGFSEELACHRAQSRARNYLRKVRRR